jgi:hypothetical protein
MGARDGLTAPQTYKAILLTPTQCAQFLLGSGEQDPESGHNTGLSPSIYKGPPLRRNIFIYKSYSKRRFPTAL